MRSPTVRYSGLLLLAVLGLAAHSDATPIVTLPPSLSPGDTYRLIFVTRATRDATSPNITDYNTFVTNAAAAVPELAALAATWTSIASTVTVNALDNIGAPFPHPIYRLDGTLVAVGSGGLFSGGALLAPIAFDEQGAASGGMVFTGTTAVGTAFAPLGLDGGVLSGYSWDDSHFWTQAIFIDSHDYMHLYAISPPLTAPVPEPGTFGLTALGGTLLFLAWRRRQQKGRKVLSI